MSTAVTEAFPDADFPLVARAIRDGLDRGLHTGVQIAVFHHGECVLNSALCSAGTQDLVTSDSIMLWRSAGKPLTAALILMLIEQGRLTLDSSLSELLPESADSDKARVTVFDLLTHQAGFPDAVTGWPDVDWPVSIQHVIAAPRSLEVGTAAYHPQSSWFLLGEIARRRFVGAASTSFQTVMREKLLDRLGCRDTFCGVPPEFAQRHPERTPTLFERQQGTLAESPYCRDRWLNRESPGGNMRGPVTELARFYEILRCDGLCLNGTRLLSAAIVHSMTDRHRVAQFDRTLQHVVDFGLGVVCDSNRHGIETVPYGFGRHCSPRTFGHGGSQCSMGFCDPEHELSVAWAANGFCGEPQHQRRNRAINEAVYRDLKLA